MAKLPFYDMIINMNNMPKLNTCHNAINNSEKLAHAVQQRNILSQMGIDYWISSSQTVQSIDEVMPLIGNSDHYTSTTGNKLANNKVTSIDKVDVSQQQSRTNTSVKNLTDFALEIAKKTSAVEDSKLTNTLKANSPNPRLAEEAKLIVPFELQGLSFGNLVLFVDMQIISKDELTLWNNICLGLNVQSQSLRFPLVSNHNTAEVANASLAGFVFRLARTEKVKLVGLTDLPEGIVDKRFIKLPSLKQMLLDSLKKQELWDSLKVTTILAD